MEEFLSQATTILRATWKHRRLGMLCAWIFGAIAAAIIVNIPDRYEASARVSLDTQSILKPLMSGLAVQPNSEQQVMMLSRTLISRPNVEKVVRMADMDLGIQSKAAREAQIETLTKALEVKSTNRDNIYTISYRNTDPAVAQKVVQSLLSIFVESSLGDKRQDTDAARKFIDEQIRHSENKLREAENRLKEFKLRNVEFETSDGKGSMERLGDIAALLQKARLELREAENSRDALRRQIVGDEPVLLPEAPGADAGISLPEIDGRIDAQKRHLDTLLQKYTDKHPDVIGTRRLIKDLEEQKRTEILARRQFAAANPGAGVGHNPAYQQLKVSLGEAEATVASLRTRVAEYESRYKRTKEFMKFQPQLEAELVQLNRDYDIHKKNYEQLATRRESAELTGDLGSVAGMADFRVVDPPRASSTPVAPNRMVLLPLGLLLAIAGGFVVAFAASQLRPVFFDGKSLRDQTGLPVLGIVSILPNEGRRQQERASLMRFLLAGAALVTLFAIGIAVLTYLSQRAA
jgi:polysaccharide chain length determinant protein (PEP-CTERM system associated)